jgi:hypothetical protein
MHKRTGLRKPKKHLKTWDDKNWTRRLTPRLSVGMVDEDLPYGKEGGRKSWYLTLTQDTDLLEKLGPVFGAPTKGKTLLLFEDDVVALVQHLADADLVEMNDEGRLLNGPACSHERARKRPPRKAKR